jgi:hypothetical protein
MKNLKIYASIIIIALTYLSCNKKAEKMENSKDEKVEFIKCGYCPKKLYEGQPAIQQLTTGKYFCSETCSEMYSVYGSK